MVPRGRKLRAPQQRIEHIQKVSFTCLLRYPRLEISSRETCKIATSEVGCLLFAVYGMKREYRELSFIWEKCSLIATFPAAAQQGIFHISPRRALSGQLYGGTCKKDYSKWIEYCMRGVHSWLSVQRSERFWQEIHPLETAKQIGQCNF